MIFDGFNGGTVEVTDSAIVIRRRGIGSLLTQGLKGEKRIPFASITSVQFKEPGLTTGYIQFGVMGGLEGRGGVFNATTDENTVLFTSKALDSFLELREIVEARIGQPSQGAAMPQGVNFSLTEELGRLADLRDRGILSEDEFMREKDRLLNDRAPSPRSPKSEIPNDGFKQSETPAQVSKSKSGSGRKIGIGCLVILAILVGLAMLGSTVGPEGGSTATKASALDASDIPSDGAASDDEIAGLTSAQRNAVRSAERYLDISGFSRKGLISQLSSEAGDGYSVADATAAVDRMAIDWNENAARSAKQYLDMSGFSCDGLIEQLSSSAGDGYTTEQAAFGARKAGAC